jgi:UTP--glucose-1-phosphate uridylyltransferase
MEEQYESGYPCSRFQNMIQPATKAQPKEMLPVYDKPTIQYVIEEAIASGIDDILIVTGRTKDQLKTTSTNPTN